MKKADLNLILNLLIVLLVAAGTVIMFVNKANATGLLSSGFANFKYYTVLSNELAGVAAICQIVLHCKGKAYPKTLKLIAATATAVTFLVVALFLGPIYGWLPLYKSANLYFHLIVPIICVIEFLFAQDKEPTTIRHCAIASLSVALYGLVYAANILILGKGKASPQNDWYGFLNWGLAVGAVIWAGILLCAFGTACLLRFLKTKRKPPM